MMKYNTTHYSPKSRISKTSTTKILFHSIIPRRFVSISFIEKYFTKISTFHLSNIVYTFFKTFTKFSSYNKFFIFKSIPNFITSFNPSRNFISSSFNFFFSFTYSKFIITKSLIKTISSTSIFKTFPKTSKSIHLNNIKSKISKVIFKVFIGRSFRNLSSNSISIRNINVLKKFLILIYKSLIILIVHTIKFISSIFINILINSLCFLIIFHHTLKYSITSNTSKSIKFSTFSSTIYNLSSSRLKTTKLSTFYSTFNIIKSFVNTK